MEEAGGSLSYSVSQMRRRWDQIRELILIPLGLPPHDDLLTGIWLIQHATCCAAATFELLEADDRFLEGLQLRTSVGK
jgi:hypothetical protein